MSGGMEEAARDERVYKDCLGIIFRLCSRLSEEGVGLGYSVNQEAIDTWNIYLRPLGLEVQKVQKK